MIVLSGQCNMPTEKTTENEKGNCFDNKHCRYAPDPLLMQLYHGRTPGSETGALLSPVHGFGTLYQWNSVSRMLNLLHFGGC